MDGSEKGSKQKPERNGEQNNEINPLFWFQKKKFVLFVDKQNQQT